MWKELLEILGKLEVTYREVVPLLKQKKQALIGLKLDELKQLIDKEEQLTKKIEALENQRLEIFSAMIKQNSNIKSNMKFKEVTKLSPNRIIEQRLNLLYESLSKNIDEVKTITEENQVLATAALDATKFHLNRLSNAKVEPTYGKAGQDITTRKANYEFNA